MKELEATSTNEKLQLLGEMMKTAAIISNNTKAKVFVQYSGHVNVVDVRIYSNGWKAYEHPDYSQSFYIDCDVIEDMKDILQHLKSYIQ